MTRYAKRKLKYSLNENFNSLPYVEWDRFVMEHKRNEGYVIISNYLYLHWCSVCFGVNTQMICTAEIEVLTNKRHDGYCIKAKQNLSFHMKQRLYIFKVCK
jgi:hypothetical protein